MPRPSWGRGSWGCVAAPPATTPPPPPQYCAVAVAARGYRVGATALFYCPGVKGCEETEKERERERSRCGIGENVDACVTSRIRPRTLRKNVVMTTHGLIKKKRSAKAQQSSSIMMRESRVDHQE